jgi:hypothetical protein
MESKDVVLVGSLVASLFPREIDFGSHKSVSAPLTFETVFPVFDKEILISLPKKFSLIDQECCQLALCKISAQSVKTAKLFFWQRVLPLRF